MESQVAARDYYEALARLHGALKPRTYLEIGLAAGKALMLAGTDTWCIGVDPDLKRLVPRARQLPNAVIFEEKSDTFFATRGLDAALRGDPLDLAFIDGMHLFEYALRDLINIEANSHADTVVAVHDCLPLDAVTSSRQCTTSTWTGDVWKLVACLHRYRPDLDVTLADVYPSGVCIISGLDRHSSVLPELYARLLDEYVPLGWDFFETEMASTFSELTVSVDEAIDRLSRVQRHGARLAEQLETERRPLECVHADDVSCPHVDPKVRLAVPHTGGSTFAESRRLAVAVTATGARLSEAQAETEDVRAELAACAAQLSDIYASPMWRLSAPAGSHVAAQAARHFS